MITISQVHYKKLLQTVDLLHSTLNLYGQNHEQASEAYKSWQEINRTLVELYAQLNCQLKDIRGQIESLKQRNQELTIQLNQAKKENSDLVKNNVMQRAQLAKNQADYNKLRDVAKGLKNSLKEKDQALKTSEQTLKEKEEVAQQLAERTKKYKKLYQDQVKKVQKLDKMIAMLEVSQKHSEKEKELDNEMEYLQAQLDQLENGQ